MSTEPLSSDEYVVLSGCQCPACRTHDIEGREVYLEGTYAMQEVVCMACGAYWTDVYQLREYTCLERGTVV